MEAMAVSGELSLTTIMTDIVAFIGNILSIVTSNWLLLFLLLAPFVIGLVISLVHSLRG